MESNPIDEEEYNPVQEEAKHDPPQVDYDQQQAGFKALEDEYKYHAAGMEAKNPYIL